MFAIKENIDNFKDSPVGTTHCTLGKSCVIWYKLDGSWLLPYLNGWKQENKLHISCLSGDITVCTRYKEHDKYFYQLPSYSA